jgi:hypothetical protein
VAHSNSTKSHTELLEAFTTQFIVICKAKILTRWQLIKTEQRTTTEQLYMMQCVAVLTEHRLRSRSCGRARSTSETVLCEDDSSLCNVLNTCSMVVRKCGELIADEDLGSLSV